MTPKEQLLSFIAAVDKPTDPIRIMKGLFVFTQLSESEDWLRQPKMFDFKPMSYGPCSPAIYEALDELAAEGLIIEEPVSGETWKTYTVTDAGRSQVAAIADTHSQDLMSFIRQVRDWCDRQSFTSLLRRVYHKWPEYAKKSVLPHLRPNG